MHILTGVAVGWVARDIGAGLGAPVAGELVFVWWVFWTVSAINVTNFMDGIDAIIGLQIVVFAAFSAWSLTGNPFGLSLAGVSLGASVGFLIFNWPPARVFLGDVGSGVAGLLFVLLGALTAADRQWTVAHAFLPLLPLFADELITMARRVRRGESLITPHRSHVYQRLVQAYPGHGKVALGYAGAAALCGLWAAGLGNGSIPEEQQMNTDRYSEMGRLFAWMDERGLFENTMIVTVDGEEVYRTVLGGDADRIALDLDYISRWVQPTRASAGDARARSSSRARAATSSPAAFRRTATRRARSSTAAWRTRPTRTRSAKRARACARKARPFRRRSSSPAATTAAPPEAAVAARGAVPTGATRAGMPDAAAARAAAPIPASAAPRAGTAPLPARRASSSGIRGAPRPPIASPPTTATSRPRPPTR